MPLYAHFGHWYVSMIYAAPALLLAGALWFSTLKQRRREAAKRAKRPADPTDR
jgi:hypothetical protein